MTGVQTCALPISARYEAKIREYESRPPDQFDKGMLGCYKRSLKALLDDKFSHDSNVFDITQSSNSIPEDPTGYWAVAVDRHY